MSTIQTEIRQTVELDAKPFTEYARFDVAFRCLDRITETMAEAVAYCLRCDFDPAEIYPVVVAYETPRERRDWLTDKALAMVEPYHIFDFGKDAR